MTGKQQKKVEIQKSVMSVMEKHLTVWQSVPEIKNKYDLFVRNIKKIDDHLEVVKTDLAPFREKKLHSMKAMLEQAFPVISVLGVYAKDTGDKKLDKMVNFRSEELETMKPVVLRKYFRRIMKISRSLLNPAGTNESDPAGCKISRYGLTENHLERIQDSLDRFISDDNTFEKKRIQVKRNKAHLDQRIRDNHTLLIMQLNKLILLFRDSHKEFFEAYLSACGKSRRQDCF